MTPTKKIALGLLVCLPLMAALMACSPLGTINALASGRASQVSSDIAYGDNRRQRLDIYAPRNDAASAPVLVFFYGGNWTEGKRADYAFVGHALAARGIVAVIADYRLYPEVHYPGVLEDSAAAVAWTVREIGRYGGDPTRLFVMGHSAGAYNASMVALDPTLLAKHGLKPSSLRGWIGLAGPYDFIPIENKTVRPVFYFPNTPKESQPINHVSAAAPPALLIAAQNDKLVNPVRNTGGMAAALRGKGAAVTEYYFGNVSHASLIGSLAGPLRMLAPTLDTIVHFVEHDGGRIAGQFGTVSGATPALPRQ
ncbi:MAG: alpha/beta hydrolase [Pseudomonadota bacterium]